MAKLSRRDFLGRCATSATIITWRPPVCLGSKLEPLRFGLCADVHKDIMHDADERLAAFVKAMRKSRADFIVQLGDFCRPYEHNNSFMRVWRSFAGGRYHVLGDHDTDGGFTRQQTLAYWKAKKGYYSFDRGGYHFIVLDGNDRHEDAPKGYPRHVGAKQLQWLKQDLRESGRIPVLVFSHQSLENPQGVDNGAEVRAVLEHANKAAGWRRVLACFSGHHHLDAVVRVAGIPYVQVNSMSYYWVGGKFKRVRYSQGVDQSHPWIKYTAPYRDPLWVLAELDPKGVLKLQGVRSEWVGPSPEELGYKASRAQTGIAPKTSDQRIGWEVRPERKEEPRRR